MHAFWGGKVAIRKRQFFFRNLTNFQNSNKGGRQHYSYKNKMPKYDFFLKLYSIIVGRPPRTEDICKTLK